MRSGPAQKTNSSGFSRIGANRQVPSEPGAGRSATVPLATQLQPAGTRIESDSGAGKSSWSKQQKRSGAPVG